MKRELLLDITELEKRYGDIKALNRISLKIHQGIVGLLGPNGAGKTTMMKIMTGLINPTSGSCKVLGRNPKRGISLHRKIGYLPETFGFPTVSIWKYLVHVSRVFNQSKIQAEDSTRRVLEDLDLSNLQERDCTKLSSGQKQRLGLAQVLIHNPDILILDEPVSYLDPIGRKSFFDFFSTIEKNRSVILSSHILSDVERVCKTVIILNYGQVLYYGPISELDKSEKEVRITLIVSNPQTLLAKLNESPFVNETSIRGSKLIVETSDPISFQDSLPDYLTSTGIRLMSMSQEEKSLEDLFIDLMRRNDLDN